MTGERADISSSQAAACLMSDVGGDERREKTAVFVFPQKKIKSDERRLYLKMVIPTTSTKKTGTTAAAVAAAAIGSTRVSTAIRRNISSTKILKWLPLALPFFSFIFLSVPWILSWHLDTHQRQQQFEQQAQHAQADYQIIPNEAQQPNLIIQNQKGHSSPLNLLQSVRLQQLERQKLQEGHFHGPSPEASAADQDNIIIASPFTKHDIFQSNMTNLPQWMIDYFIWHEQQTQLLTIENWNQRDTTHPDQPYKFKYIVLRCYEQDERCGGLSDRLKPIPLMLLAAARGRRLFYISWSRPCKLEEFLRPGPGLNWSMPDWLNEASLTSPDQRSRRVATRARNLIEISEDNNVHTLYAHIHDFQGGSTQYNDDQGENMYESVYHDLFQALMVPSPPIAKRIKELLLVKSSGTDSVTNNSTNHQDQNKKALLIPGQYVVAHYRAEYGNEVRRHPILTSKDFLHRVALNAINCASALYPGGGPIYFASDSMVALKAVREFSATTSTRPIVTFDRSESQPLHLDKMETVDGDDDGKFTLQTDIEKKREQQRQAKLRENRLGGEEDLAVVTNGDDGNENNSSTNNATIKMRPTIPSDFYSTFIDFYLAGNGRCVAFGRGGFGRFANVLSYNWTCSAKHVSNFFPNICEWHD